MADKLTETVERDTSAVSDDAVRHLEIRSPLNRAIYRAIRDYRCSNMADEDGDPYPLVDLMSNPAPSDIGTGEMQMVVLADNVEMAVEAALSRPNVDEMREALEALADEVMTTINDVATILHPEPSDEPLHPAAARATNLALAVGRARAIAAGTALTKEEAEENCRRLAAGEPTLTKAGFAALNGSGNHG